MTTQTKPLEQHYTKTNVHQLIATQIRVHNTYRDIEILILSTFPAKFFVYDVEVTAQGTYIGVHILK